MRNQYYSNSRPQNEFSPLRENYNLKVDDIPGAVPKFGYTTKKIQHYATKLINDQRPFEAKLATKEQAYTSGLYHEDFSPTSTQKKHYNVHHESEILRSGLINKGPKKPMNAFSAGLPPPSLEIDTRPYIPASNQSQSVKNYEYANKVVDSYPSPQRYNAHQDSLDQFQQRQNQRGHSEDKRYNLPPQEAAFENQRDQSFSYSQRQQEDYYPRQQYAGSRQELGDAPNSSRHAELDRLSKEIVLQQQALEQKMRETMRRRAFNIISNQSTPQYGDQYSTRYGSSIKGMIKNTEYTRTGFGNTKGWGNFQTTTRTQDPYYQTGQNQEASRKQYSDQFVAGMNNDYAETNYRYANQLPQQQPLPKDQYYGARALKNLSGVKLY